MRSTHKYLAQITLLCLISGIMGCKKFVSIPPPTTELVTTNVFSSDATATAAQTVIYSQMEANMESFEAALQNGLLGDELTTYSSTQTTLEFYMNAMQAKDILTPWSGAYNYIYQANAVLNGLQSNNGVTAAGRQQLMGEATFTRAFWLFLLSNCYGDVPITTSTDYVVNAAISRSPKSDVFQQVIADLTNAVNLLNPNYVDGTDTATTNDRIRPNKWSAMALLARAYLYAGKYDSSELASTSVINSGAYILCQDLDSVFLADNTEAIWQIPPTEPSSNPITPDAQFFVLTTAPGSALQANTTISPQLMAAFENGDLRKADWIGVYPSDTTNYYFPNKYKLIQTSSPLEYTVVLRLAEQYLIRAEAEANLNDLTDAATDLNTIRHRAGLPNIADSIASSQTSLLTAIVHERQVELFCEWGHRWFDLNRTGTINNVMSVVTPLKTAGQPWSPYMALYPLPLTELKSDPKLVQNPGY